MTRKIKQLISKWEKAAGEFNSLANKASVAGLEKEEKYFRRSAASLRTIIEELKEACK